MEEGELFKIFLTSAITIFGSVIIYVCGQLISKFIIDPIHNQKITIAEIIDTVIFRANKFGFYESKNPESDKAVGELRLLASKLRSKTYLIPFYQVWQWCGWILSKAEIEKAASALIGLSNSFYKNGSIPNSSGDHREELSKVFGVKL